MLNSFSSFFRTILLEDGYLEPSKLLVWSWSINVPFGGLTMVEAFPLFLLKVFSSLDVPLGASSPLVFHRLCKLLNSRAR